MPVDVVLVVVGGLLVALALVSRALQRLSISGALLALCIGIAIGPHGASLLHPIAAAPAHTLLEETARIVLSVVLVGIGLRFTREDLKGVGPRAVRLLAVGMPGMWITMALGGWLLLDLEPWRALLVAAMLAITDPVIAGSITTDRLAETHVPRGLRRTLQLEAGGNDSLAIVLVLLPLTVLTHDGLSLATWALESAREIGIAVGVGVLLGASTAWLVERARRRPGLETPYIPAVGVALALLSLGGTHALGGSGILAAFATGLTFSLRIGHEQRVLIEESHNAFERLSLVFAFVVFGAGLPWQQWVDLGWPGLAFAGWAVFVRRPPVIPAALIRTPIPPKEKAFLAWFGPLGVASIYYATFVGRSGIDDPDQVFAAVTLAVALSVVVHGLVSTPSVMAFAGRSPFAGLRRPLDPATDRPPGGGGKDEEEP